MTDSNKPPVWFWIVSVIGFIWNAMGVNMYLQQAFNTESFRAMYSQEELDIAANNPAWVTAAYAIAVFAATLGCLALLFRKKVANSLLILSLIAVMIQMGYAISQDHVSNVGMTIMIIVFAVLIVLFAKHSNTKGWIS